MLDFTTIYLYHNWKNTSHF